jgi:hypothetical protein
MTFDIESEVRQLTAIGEPFLYRIGLAGLLARYGTERVRCVLIEEAARTGAVSIAAASGWCRLPRPHDRKAG